MRMRGHSAGETVRADLGRPGIIKGETQRGRSAGDDYRSAA